ncbi:hypothetical protein Q9233_017832, partial [Columba guinea]
MPPTPPTSPLPPNTPIVPNAPDVPVSAGALSRCSACLRVRLEELRRLQGQRRAEWQLLRGRWGQARALVERLRRERHGDTGDNGDPQGHLMSMSVTSCPLATAREAQAAAERHAQDVTQRAELQLQALRRQLELAQLQVAYHHLFQEYDAHIKLSADGDARQQAGAPPVTPPRFWVFLGRFWAFLAQAEIYRADFAAERAAREQLHAQRDVLQEALRTLRAQLDARANG